MTEMSENITSGVKDGVLGGGLAGLLATVIIIATDNIIPGYVTLEPDSYLLLTLRMIPEYAIYGGGIGYGCGILETLVNLKS